MIALVREARHAAGDWSDDEEDEHEYGEEDEEDDGKFDLHLNFCVINRQFD